MTDNIKVFAEAIDDLAKRIQLGAQAIILEAGDVPDAAPAALRNEKALFDAIREAYGRILPEQFQVIKAGLERAFLDPAAEREAPTVGISSADYQAAAKRLGWSVPQIVAVDITESAGGGWFTDLRADILALDGDGGFLSGSALPKILYEAHVFARNCDPVGEFNETHPNLSSRTWNKALYIGGQAEYSRLWKAMQLDRVAAFKAISIGRYQILGENHKLAGFGTAEGFHEAMSASESAHLDAFVTFIINSGLVDEGRRISAVPEDNIPFAKGYNGSRAVENGYPAKIAKHYKAALQQ